MMKKNWSNYFCDIANKYNMRLSKSKPIVVFIDGKDITKSFKHDLVYQNKNSFNDVFNNVVKDFSKQFDCKAICGVDEVSFIFEDARALEKKIKIDTLRCQEIVSVISQIFYKNFKEKYTLDTVYWHCKCSNIPKGKVNSYIRYRSQTIYELSLTYFLKRKQQRNAGQIDIAIKQQMCEKYEDYEQFKKYEKGNMYINGHRIDTQAFIDGKIEELSDIQREDYGNFLDITNFK